MTQGFEQDVVWQTLTAQGCGRLIEAGVHATQKVHSLLYTVDSTRVMLSLQISGIFSNIHANSLNKQKPNAVLQLIRLLELTAMDLLHIQSLN